MINRFFTRYSFTIIILVVFFLPVLTRGARMAMTSNDNKVEDWLPQEYPETQDLRWFKQHFENETFILISWQGCTVDDPRLELLETKLRTHVNLIYPKPATLIQAGLQKLFPPKIAPEPIVGEPLFATVETGRTMLNRLMDGAKITEEEAERRLAGLFVGKENHKQSCAIVTLTAEAKRDLRHTLDCLYELLQHELALPRDRVKLGGPPVDNVAISTEGEKTLARLFGPAGVVGLALAYWCLRSTRLTMMVFVTAIYAGAISLSLVYYSGSAMNAILLTMPAVVYVAAISGAIHFANYYRGAAVKGGVEGAPARAVSNAWIPCTLSAVTSAAGLASLYTSELIPIKLFGVYTALGVLTTLILLFLFLPAWMQLWPMKKNSALDGDAPDEEELELPLVWRRILSGCLRRWPLVLAAGVALLVVCGIGLTKINTSIKLTKLFSSGAEIIKNYEWLEENLGPLVPMEVVLRFDNTKNQQTMYERAELVGKVQKSLQQIDEVGNTMSAVTFAPPLKAKSMGPMISKNVVRNTWNKQLERHRQEYLDGGFLAIDGDTELWRINARVGALNDVDYGLFLNDLRAKVEPVLAAERKRILTDKAKAAKEKPNVEAIALAIAPTGEEPAPLGIDAVYTGLVPVVYKAQYQMLVGLGENFIYDLLTIAGVMTFVFRDFSAGLILLVPSVFPVMVVFGLMGWFGVTIDVGTIMTPTVALGVSVDDVVHFLIWYRRGLSEGKSRHDSVMLAYEDCARAMYQSWSVLGLGLAVFALSSFVPTQRFGAMMFCLLTAALIGNLLILPAVLCSPIAALFGRGLRRKALARIAAEQAAGESSEELPEEQFGLEPVVGPAHHKPATAPAMASASPTGLHAGGLGSSPMGPAGKGSPSAPTGPFRHDAPHRSSQRS